VRAARCAAAWQLHKPLAFTTSPFAKYTHWKQTVFYLKKALTVCAGEEIKGRIECSPNAKNPRDLDVQIAINFEGNCMQARRRRHARAAAAAVWGLVRSFTRPLPARCGGFLSSNSPPQSPS
jgi:hypothetical protein